MFLDPERLAASLPADGWSEPSPFRVTEVHHLYRRSTRVEGLGWALAQFAPVRKAFVSSIAPGGFIRPHVDPGKPPGYYERWLLTVHPAGWNEQNGQRITPEAGEAFQLRHWEPHAVVVPADEPGPRVVVVIDRDVVAHPPGDPATEWGLRRLPVGPDIEPLLRSA